MSAEIYGAIKSLADRYSSVLTKQVNSRQETLATLYKGIGGKYMEIPHGSILEITQK